MKAHRRDLRFNAKWNHGKPTNKHNILRGNILILKGNIATPL
jgi:hypothetical protein